MQCTTCNGIGFMEVVKPQTFTKVVHSTSEGYPCWPHQGGTAVQETFTTGRMINVNEICEDCHGGGLMPHPDFDPNCHLCAGIGTMTVADGHGGVDFDVCTCKVSVESEAA